MEIHFDHGCQVLFKTLKSLINLKTIIIIPQFIYECELGVVQKIRVQIGGRRGGGVLQNDTECHRGGGGGS